MLKTPLGLLQITINDTAANYTYIQLPPSETHCPDVDGRYCIQPEEFEDISKIQCFFSDLEIKGEPESGERYEAITFYKDDFKLTIGVNADFPSQPPGRLLENGIEIYVRSPIQFGICWLNGFTDENDIQTYLGADLFYMRRYNDTL